MIDTKVLEKLAQLDDATILRRLPDSERTFFEYGFQRGYNRALKDLWHPNTEEPDKSKSDILITMLIYNLKNPSFGMRNLGDIRLADAKSSSGLIYLTYCQSRKEVNNENIYL